MDFNDKSNSPEDQNKHQVGQHVLKQFLNEYPEDKMKFKLDNNDDQLQNSIQLDDNKHDQQKFSQYLSPINSANNMLNQRNQRQSDSADSYQNKNSKQNTASEQQIMNSPQWQFTARGFIGNASNISYSQPISLAENQLIQLEDDSSDGDSTYNKDILSEIDRNISRIKNNVQESSKRESVDLQKEESNEIDFKKIKPFQIMYQSLVFIAKLMRASSSFRFRNITWRQFNIIDDFSSDFEYYIYINKKIKTFVNTFPQNILNNHQQY